MSSIEYDLIVPTEFSKLDSSSFSYLTYFVLLLSKWHWPVCDPFLDYYFLYFSIFFCRVFCKNCGYLFCLTCKILYKKLWRSREWRVQEKQKKSYSRVKRICLGVIYFWRPQKKSKLRLFVSSQPEVLLQRSCSKSIQCIHRSTGREAIKVWFQLICTAS